MPNERPRERHPHEILYDENQMQDARQARKDDRPRSFRVPNYLTDRPLRGTETQDNATAESARANRERGIGRDIELGRADNPPRSDKNGAAYQAIINENIRTLKSRGFSEADAIRQANSLPAKLIPSKQ